MTRLSKCALRIILTATGVERVNNHPFRQILHGLQVKFARPSFRGTYLTETLSSPRNEGIFGDKRFQL